MIIFGSLAMGASGHFRTAHSIMGLLTTVLACAAIILHYFVVIKAPEASAGGIVKEKTSRLPVVRAGVNQLLLLLAMITTITGFIDLSAISMCLSHIIPVEAGIAMGFMLAGVYTLGQAVSALDLWIKYRQRNGAPSNIREKGGRMNPEA